MPRSMGVLTKKAIVAEIEVVYRGRFVDQSEL
jgi:hypothetical protein